MNTTYGYTGASFSGRMPCCDIADSVVDTGKAILMDTIKCIESTRRWDAKVIYGDTDSVFVEMRGRSLEEAYRLGEEMA